MSAVFAPFIQVPPLTYCDTAFLVFGAGTPPYKLFPFTTASSNASALEYIPDQKAAGTFSWTVDILPGTNITWAIIDTNGLTGYSSSRLITQGSIASCPANIYRRKSNVGAIAGGVVGGVIGLLLIALLAWFFLRRHKKAVIERRRRTTVDDLHPAARGDIPLAAESDKASSVGAGSPAGEQRPGGATGLRRAGTYNLGDLEFTPTSLDGIRKADEPPTYEGRRSRRNA